MRSWMALVTLLTMTLIVMAGMMLRHEPQLEFDKHASTDEWVDVPIGD